jgi:hypothetical protein
MTKNTGLRKGASATEAIPPRPEIASTNSWWQRTLVLGIFVVCAAAYLWARHVTLPMHRAPDGHYVLSDPDSYMHWRLVTRALNGEGVRIRWMNEDNAPVGRMNEWTSPMTILGVGLVHAAEAFGGMPRAQALEWGGVWMGPLVGLLSLAALGYLGWRVGGWSLAACWMVAWPVLEDVIQMTGCGHTGHGSLHQLLFICLVGGCLACARKPFAFSGTLIGLVSGAAVWSAGSELLPALGLVAGLAVYETGWLPQDEKRTRFWRGWWIAGLMGTMAAWLFEFWPHVFHGRLEFISIWHVSVWIIGGYLLECLARRRQAQRTKWLLIGGAVLLSVIVAGGAHGFSWRHLHVLQEEKFHQETTVTSEFEPYAKNGLDVALKKTWWKYGLLPLCVFPIAYRFPSLSVRQRWLAVVLTVFTGLMLWEIRWMDMFAPALVMTVGVALMRCSPRRPWANVGVVILATLPPWFLAAQIRRNVAAVHGDSLRGPYVETFALRAVSDCLEQAAKDGILLAAWDQGGTLAGMGKVRVIGSAYWSNSSGLSDTFELFTTHSRGRFFELVRQRQVDFVLIPSPDRLARAVWLSSFAITGHAPTREDAFGAYIWRIANDTDLSVISCPSLSQLAPGWRILRLPKEPRVE